MSGIVPGKAPSKAQEDTDSPYTLRELLKDVPLTDPEDSKQPYITCVDFWDTNLYIGASNGELLHFVSIPGETESGPPTFILASRQEPAFIQSQSTDSLPGVQQILLLPSVKKACVVCNNTLTFYTLPELSPAFAGKIKQGDCNWVGGIDENVTFEDDEDVVIIICLKQRLRLIKIGEQARKVRDIEIPGCLGVRRRGDLACVADEKSYSLIDVVNQRKIDLFPVSSTPALPERTPSPQPRSRPSVENDRPRPVSMHFPSNSPVRDVQRRGHERISSLGAQPRNTDMLAPDSPTWPSRRSSRQLSPAPDGTGSPIRARSPLAPRGSEDSSRDLPPEPVSRPETPPPLPDPLRPIILSPTPNEFLLTTGTLKAEPGVGMFVNQEGDVSRGTLEFSSYPSAVILEGVESAGSESPQTPSSQHSEASILAITKINDSSRPTIEIQSLDSDQQSQKATLALPDIATVEGCVPGLRQSVSLETISTPKIIHSLGLRRLYLTNVSQDIKKADETKIEQEDRLIERFAHTTTRSIFFGGRATWWLVRQPLLLKLDARLEAAVKSTSTNGLLVVNRNEVQHVFNGLRGRDPQDEIEFMTFNYIRQKAAILLLLDLLIKTAQKSTAAEQELRYTQETLTSSDVEPRVVLSLIPALKGEVVEGTGGIWVPGGLQALLDLIRNNKQLENLSHENDAVYWNNILPLIKGYLSAWRKKKGFGSIADEAHVFQTVDAALLHVLLILDQQSPSGPAAVGSLRAELNEVVDKGVDCFDRAVSLLESFHRLYILSRLYQNKKMVPQVLATWRRILEGEDDRGGELVDGESDVRKYLTRIKDAGLVREYGTWLANRNPSLGVQIFADDNSRVKFTTAEAVDLLKAKAPNAVKYYLEYLVFSKKQSQYATDLTDFYLSSLLSEITTSASTREAITTTNEVYHSIPPPKPTFVAFLTDNVPQSEWHANRLRLLQLLGRPSPASSKLDIPSLSARLEPHADLLLPESIILASLQSEHEAAIHALVHKLADFDTAGRYCLLTGQSVFQPAKPSSASSSSKAGGISTIGTALSARKYRALQSRLFNVLLDAYLSLPDPIQRLERAAELLERFGGWFDAAAVLARVPDEWPVRVLEGFLGTALRGLVRDRREAGVLKALAAGENLRVGVELVERIERGGAVVQRSGDVGDYVAGSGSGSGDGDGGVGKGGKSWADSGYGSAGTGLGSVESAVR